MSMTIVMLGHSGAGKTTYVSLMYSELQTPVNGFTLSGSAHSQLMTDAYGIRRGRYPDPTHQRVSFDLELCHDGRAVFPFTWRDYRGGALSDRSSAADAEQLHADLLATDGIVLFVDATRLVGDPRVGRDVRRLTTHVHRALDARDKVLTPVVIAVTKCDLVDLDGPGVERAIFEPFTPLGEAIEAAEHVCGTMLPIACGPEPVNVAVPVLFALHFGIVGHGMRLEAAIEQYEAAAHAFSASDTLRNRVSSWWNEVPSNAEMAHRYREQAFSERERLEPLIEPARRLGDLLADVPCF